MALVIFNNSLAIFTVGKWQADSSNAMAITAYCKQLNFLHFNVYHKLIYDSEPLTSIGSDQWYGELNLLGFKSALFPSLPGQTSNFIFMCTEQLTSHENMATDH